MVSSCKYLMPMVLLAMARKKDPNRDYPQFGFRTLSPEHKEQLDNLVEEAMDLHESLRPVSEPKKKKNEIVSAAVVKGLEATIAELKTRKGRRS
jgi:hypothetical protein